MEYSHYQRPLLIAAMIGWTLAGCSTSPRPAVVSEAPLQAASVQNVQDNPVPGTVTEDWEEPMYDQVKIPGQLDPTATYYRNPHSTVVEIRSGRYQEVQFPDDKPDQRK